MVKNQRASVCPVQFIITCSALRFFAARCSAGINLDCPDGTGYGMVWNWPVSVMKQQAG
jgi:hypothetical protein